MTPPSTIPVPSNTHTILRPFGLVASSEPEHVFESALIYAAGDIRKLYPTCDYDHRPESPDHDRQFPFIQTEQFRRGYAAFKYAVARVLQPRTICEIGIGAGVATRAFLAGAPHAQYTGIDDGSKDASDNCHLIDYTRKILIERGYRHEIILTDSMKLAAAPCVDLFHVDGSHDFEHALNDTRLAIESGSLWILIDDSRDINVSAAAFMAAYAARSKAVYDWTHFEDTWTGSILMHRIY